MGQDSLSWELTLTHRVDPALVIVKGSRCFSDNRANNKTGIRKSKIWKKTHRIRNRRKRERGENTKRIFSFTHKKIPSQGAKAVL